MLIQIIRHTPTPIWLLLIALIALGANQLRDRQVSRTRLKVLPVVLAALSAVSLVNTFGASAGALTLAIGAWGLGSATAWVLGRGLFSAPVAVGVSPKAWVHVPGSAWPLVLIVGLFAIRYTTGVSLVLHPDLTHNARFVVAISLAAGSSVACFWPVPTPPVGALHRACQCHRSDPARIVVNQNRP